MNRKYSLVKAGKWRIKSAITALGILLGVFCMENVQAQTIVDNLQSQTNASDGIIRIKCDPSIIALIGKPNGQLAASSTSNFVERNGFRIQVCMEKVRTDAASKQSAIQSAFPELFTDLRFEAPNWRLLVGNFMTREEAVSVQQHLQKEFPSFGKEMYIVQDKIRLFIER